MKSPINNSLLKTALPEAISFWLALSSPLTGLIIGFLGAWFFNWLTS